MKDAVAALQEAIDGLKKESGKPDGGDEGDKPDGGGEGSRPDDSNKPGGNDGNDNKPNAGNSGSGNDKNSGSEAGKVKTGDSASIMLWVLLLGASVLGCFTVLRRQRRQK